MRFAWTAIVVVSALAWTPPSLAQTDLLKSGKGALDLLGGGGTAKGSGTSGVGLSDGDIGSGLKKALSLGAQRAVSTVGKPGGFLNNNDIHIPLPGPLEKLRSGLAAVGASGMADDLEQRMNRAAEEAAPKATSIFVNAVKAMSIEDARSILSGPQDAATQYFKRVTSSDLKGAMKPIVDKSLANVGALQSLSSLTDRAKSLPFGAGSGVNFDMNDYVLGKALDGIFLYLGREEASIRQNPAARTTDLLKKVFN